MKLLLDTHTAIWFVTDSKELPKSAKQLIENPDNHCFISIATLWEMGIKYSLGKLKLKSELNKIFELFFESGLILIPITPDHILTNTTLPFQHRDPFDRLIISQAKREGYTIITKDVAFENYDVNLVWEKIIQDE